MSEELKTQTWKRAIANYERRIASRDRKIAGLKRRIELLAWQIVDARQLPRDIERAVTRALSNVRMIPVIGVGHDEKIVTVRAEPKQTGEQKP